MTRQWLWPWLFGLVMLAGGLPQGVGEEPGRDVTEDYVVRRWRTEDGLPQNSPTAITQTRDGYLWLGTFNGLVRFDGIKFRTFTVANAPGLTSDSISALLEDRAGRLWVGTDGGGAVCVQNGHFTPFLDTQTPGAAVVTSLAEDAQGSIWVLTDGGLFQVRDERLTRVDPRILPEGDVASGSLCRDRQGGLWLIAGGKAYGQGPDGFRAVATDRPVRRLVPAAIGGVWGSLENDQFVELTANPIRARKGSITGYPSGLLYTRHGNLWVGWPRGLELIQEGASRFYQTSAQSPLEYVSVVYEDREGGVWVGMNGGGLLRMEPLTLATISRKNGLPGDDVVLLQPGPDGEVWIGGYGLGLGYWKSGSYQRWSGFLDRNEDVYALAPSARGGTWVGVRDRRLLLRERGQTVAEEKFTDEATRVILESSDGDLWLGSRSEGVLHRHGSVSTRTGPAQGLSHGYVTALAEDREHAIWVGTKRGLNRIQAGQVRVYGRQEGLLSECVHTLYVDSEGILWVGTASGGLARLKDGRFVTCSSLDGLPNDVIAQILEDGRGYLWFGSNAGLIRLHRQELLDFLDGKSSELRPLTLDREDGMLNPECAGSFQPSCFRAADGKLWFATVGGVVVVDPARFSTNAFPPSVYVEGVASDEVTRWLAPAMAGPAKSIFVPPGATRLRVDYAGVGFQDADHLRYRTRLVPFDNRWLEAGTARQAFYSRVPPGTYTFEAMALPSSGVTSPGLARMQIVVQPFWWQTRLARGAGAVAALAALGALTWVVHRRRLLRMLERVEQANQKRRTEELGRANQELQARKTELESALANVRTLSGLIPICAHCKKVRDDRGYWEQVEAYVTRHSSAQFSHGFCPECIRAYYPEMFPSPGETGSDNNSRS